MRVLAGGDRCYLRDTCDLLVAGMLIEMFGHKGGHPAPDALAVARG
jgi:hypothetical protein